MSAEGRIILSTNTILNLKLLQEWASRNRFWERPTAELRSLVETASDQDVRRTALALLRYAECSTMKEAVEAVPYGVG